MFRCVNTNNRNVLQYLKRWNKEGVFEKNDKSTSNKHNYPNLQHYGLFGKMRR